jgi:microcin C transport system substrate-binding protein
MKTTPSRSRAIAMNRPNRFAQFVAISVLSVGTLIACVGALRADDNFIVAQTFTTLGSPKYPADFAHFDYVNPDAPKGGEISFAAVGTFNSLMPFSRKGDPASLSSVMVERFMETSLDDPNTDYGLLAERLEYPKATIG